MRKIEVDLSLYTISTLQNVFDVNRNTIARWQRDKSLPFKYDYMVKLVNFLRWGK